MCCDKIVLLVVFDRANAVSNLHGMKGSRSGKGRLFWEMSEESGQGREAGNEMEVENERIAATNDIKTV